MRLRRASAGRVPAGLDVDGPGGTDLGGQGTGDTPLQGSWSATRWQYRSRSRPDGVVDLICDLSGTVTLSLSRDRYVLTWRLAGEEPQALGGSYLMLDSALEFLPEELGQPEVAEYRLGSQELSLSSEMSGWDFDGDGGEEPASFVAVFVRL